MVTTEERPVELQDRPSAAVRADVFATLADHRFIALTTFRRNGAPVPTPVWFALDSGSLYVVTEVRSGKVRRLRRNPRVLVAPSDARGKPKGPAIEATACVLSAADGERAWTALRARYGWQIRAFAIYWRLRRKEHCFLEIAPAS